MLAGFSSDAALRNLRGLPEEGYTSSAGGYYRGVG